MDLETKSLLLSKTIYTQTHHSSVQGKNCSSFLFFFVFFCCFHGDPRIRGDVHCLDSDREVGAADIDGEVGAADSDGEVGAADSDRRLGPLTLTGGWGH